MQVFHFSYHTGMRAFHFRIYEGATEWEKHEYRSKSNTNWLCNADRAVFRITSGAWNTIWVFRAILNRRSGATVPLFRFRRYRDSGNRIPRFRSDGTVSFIMNSYALQRKFITKEVAIMTKYREIIRLAGLNLSQTNIALSCNASKTTVNKVLKAAKE